MGDSIAYEVGRRHRRWNRMRSSNPYGAVMVGLLPKGWLTRCMLLWGQGWDDQDADLAMEMS